jgi:hypothetical protein
MISMAKFYKLNTSSQTPGCHMFVWSFWDILDHMEGVSLNRGVLDVPTADCQQSQTSTKVEVDSSGCCCAILQVPETSIPMAKRLVCNNAMQAL